MNNVILIGRLTKDAELRYTQSNKAVASFTLAVNGYKKDDTDFINCVVWDKQAENLSKYTHKGSQVAVSGRIQTRNYEAQDGSRKYITEVVCNNVQFLDTKKQTSKEKAEQFNAIPGTFDDDSVVEITDESLPF